MGEPKPNRRHFTSNPISKSPKQAPSSSSSSKPPGDDSSTKSKKSKVTLTDNQAATDPIRLHITPLTADSAKAIVSAEHLQDASFHAIDTFPERSYGFVTVPRSEAEKLKRKYNGTVFRGVKMSVEEARPVVKSVKAEKQDDKMEKIERISPRRNGREEGVLKGFEIPDGRQVKRGWTNLPKAGEKGKSKGTISKSECLFKTVLPPVVAAKVSKKDLAGPEGGKKDKKKKRPAGKNEVIIREFKNTTNFPSFIKENQFLADPSVRSAEYVEDVGWVDAQGNVVEGPPPKRRRLSSDEATSSEKDEKPGSKASEPATDDSTGDDSSSSQSASSSSDEADSKNDESEDVEVSQAGSQSSSSDSSEEDEDDETSSEDSSGSESDSASSKDEMDEDTPAKPAAKQVSSNFANLTSIFKPKLSLETEPSGQFKFFGADFGDEEEEEATGDAEKPEEPSIYDSMPFTPVTPRTGYRSGAPTPDTALAPRFRDFLPFTRDVSIEREYFPTLLAEKPESETVQKPSPRIKLFFAHTYDKQLHKNSHWSSIVFPKILTEGKLVDRKQRNIEDAPAEEPEAVVEEPTPIKETFPIKRPDSFAASRPVPDHSINITTPKSGLGSSIQGWSGKKKTFNDDEDVDMQDAAPPKAKMGVGSGVVGWAGKKKTFDDEDDDFSAVPPPPRMDTLQAKAKTGVGSGVTGWAGKKMTFGSDDDDDLGPVNPQVDALPAKAMTGAGSGVTGWAGRKMTFESEEEEDGFEAQKNTPATKVPAKVSSKDDDSSDEESTEQLSFGKTWEQVFYEHRGEWNRQWKKKKRDVAKAKRRKENAKRGWTASA